MAETNPEPRTKARKLLKAWHREWPENLRFVGVTGASIEAGHPGASTLPEIIKGPEFSIIEKLHRGRESFVSFHSKHRPIDGFDVCSVRVRDLKKTSEKLRDLLDCDSFFSVNSFYRGGFGYSRRVPGLPRAFREARGLRYLNACFADLDSYRVGMSDDEAIEALRTTYKSQIPLPSFIAKSGRGVWVFWLLHDPARTEFPPRAFARNLRVYHRLQKVIGERLATLGADAQARDPSRIARIPGSLHPGTNRRVQYFALRSGRAKEQTYSLQRLAAFFGLVSLTEENTAGDSTDATEQKQVKTQQDRKKWAKSGYCALYEKRYEQFVKLKNLRGGYREGCRNHAALLLANTLLRLGRGKSIPEEIIRFGSECIPPLTPKECDGAIAQAHTPKKILNQTIADWLHITEWESSELETWPIASEYGERNTKRKKKDSPPSRRAQNKTLRQEAIRRLVETARATPSIRDMCKLLLEKEQIKASRMTVLRDYAEMNITSSK